MHELSMPFGSRIVRTTAAKSGLATSPSSVCGSVAPAVAADALRFTFDCSKAGTPAAAATLEIEEIPVGGHCDCCDRDFTNPEPYVLACPLCGVTSFRVTTGDELHVLDLEGEP
jgi:Zn finger protein HypA/HybF involved in hydrogenase expression